MLKKGFDEMAYAQGHNNFKAGMSLRQVIERAMTAEASGIKDEDTKAMSEAIGFADAFINKVRGY